MRQGLLARGCMSGDDSTESLQPACYLSRIPGETAADALRHCITAFPFSGLKLTAISYDLRGMLRGEQLISHIDDRHYALILQLEGRGAVMQGETETTLKTGDIIIVDTASTTLSRVFAQSRQLCVKLPRALLQARLSSGAIKMACLIEGSGVFGRLLRSLIDALTGAAGTLSRREERGIRDALIDLAVAALRAEIEPPLELRVFRPTAARHWALLRQSIEALLSDPGLSPVKLAEAAQYLDAASAPVIQARGNVFQRVRARPTAGALPKRFGGPAPGRAASHRDCLSLGLQRLLAFQPMLQEDIRLHGARLPRGLRGWAAYSL